MRSVISTLALILPCLCPNPLFATTVIPYPNLGEAAKYSQCVVLAQAIDTVGTDFNGTYYHDMRFKVIASIKGALWPDTVITIRPISCKTGGYDIDIAGDFKPTLNKIYLLFIYQQGDCWKPVMLSYYAYELFFIDTDKFLVPTGGDGMEISYRPDGQAVEPLGVYQEETFLSYLKSFVASPKAIWNGSIGRSDLQATDFAATDRAVPTGCDFALGGNLTRWQNAAIPIYYDDTGIPSNWSTVFANTLSAMNSNYTGTDPSNAGSASYTPNCANNSAYQGNFRSFIDNNLNGPQSALIIFDDPCNEIPDLNNCSGTLGIGGSYSSSASHVFDGVNWKNANYGFLIINNGVPACLSNTSFERMVSHELTHAYRMGHLSASTYPNQNMNPTCCNAINTKDRECMNYAYPSPAPVSLLSFEASLQEDGEVKLQWVTASEKDNAYFTLQRSGNGIQYETIQQINGIGSNTGGSYQWIDARPLTGINYYLLSQTDFDGSVQRLSIKAVTVGQSNPLVLNANPVIGESLSYSLDIAGVFDGTLEIMDTKGRVLISAALLLEKSATNLQQPLGELPAGIYLLRLYNGQSQWTTRFLRQ